MTTDTTKSDTTRKAVTVRMSQEEKRLLRTLAAVKDMDVNATILWAVRAQAVAMRLDAVLDDTQAEIGREDSSLSVVA